MTCWVQLNNGSYIGDQSTDGKFVPISDRDKAILEVALRKDMEESREYYTNNPDAMGQYSGDNHWLERLEATHFFIFVAVPEDIEEYDEDDITWWDFGCTLAKQVDGVWYVWSEDPSDVGNIWYQSTYRKPEAYGVRDLCIEWAERGELYNEPSECEYGSITHKFYEAVKSQVMTWW